MSLAKQQLNCPHCGEVLDQVEAGYWQCLRCGGEWLPGDPEADPFKGWKACYQEDIKRKNRRPGGGSQGKQKGRKRSRPLLSERWRLE